MTCGSFAVRIKGAARYGCPFVFTGISKLAKAKTVRKTKKPAKKLNDKGKKFAIDAAKIARDKNCNDIVILDLRGKSPAADFFVIATGTSKRQIHTVCDEIMKFAKAKKQHIFGKAGLETAHWALLDYVDVVIHIFDAEYREYYDLELLWGDAEKVEIDE